MRSEFIHSRSDAELHSLRSFWRNNRPGGTMNRESGRQAALSMAGRSRGFLVCLTDPKCTNPNFLCAECALWCYIHPVWQCKRVHGNRSNSTGGSGMNDDRESVAWHAVNALIEDAHQVGIAHAEDNPVEGDGITDSKLAHVGFS